MYGIIKEFRGNKSEACGIPDQVCGNEAVGQPGNSASFKNKVIEKEEVYGNIEDLHRKKREVYGIIKEVHGNKPKTRGIPSPVHGTATAVNPIQRNSF